MDIRPVKPEEQDAARKLIQEQAPWMRIPPLNSLLGKFRDGRLVGVIGFQMMPVVECLVGETGLDKRDLMCAMDGRLSGLPSYRFFICEHAKDFRAIIKRHFGEIMDSEMVELFTRTRE
jgi:hypothetical protein